jgi:hypothetical protein
MIAHIIGCGDSGKHWPGTGFSIGVNDCWKFGKETSCLLIVNNFHQYPERKEIIWNSTPKHGFYTNMPGFATHPNYKPLIIPRERPLIPFTGRTTRVQKGYLYKSITSPIIAVSLAWSMGFDKMVLWGVDFVNHNSVNGKKADREVSKYVEFNRALNKQGAGMYLGATDTFNNTGAFAGLLPNFKYVNV